jgi:hypothetical protein
MPAPQIIQQFKITLLDTWPVIWRRIQIPTTGTFLDLHAAIQSSMGWKNCHLHMFRIGKRSEILIMGDPIDDPFDDADENTFNGRETPVAQFLNKPGDVAIYEYDMGDAWLHEILLEGVLLKEKGVKYPRCLAGERACPPEDCGGTPGFENLLEILGKPDDPEYEALIDWLGDEYDPDDFDPATVKFSGRRKRRDG